MIYISTNKDKDRHRVSVRFRYYTFVVIIGAIDGVFEVVAVVGRDPRSTRIESNAGKSRPVEWGLSGG